MKSLHCVGKGVVAIVEKPDPRPQPGEALVRIDASAVCGSEHRALMEGLDGNVGHAARGTIVDPGASKFGAGTRVGTGAVGGCGECDRCVAGQELHCHRGPTVHSGWHAELAAVPASTGSWYYAKEDYPEMLGLFNLGLPLERLCTHDVAASHAQGAITEFLHGRSGKVVLRWSNQQGRYVLNRTVLKSRRD
jgi:D-arabinose 1-dehydrogenase-like Zn-dependent alcohol dehydrogenase